MSCKDMPTKYKICKHLDKLNANWNRKSTPGEAEGIQISFKESLEEQIKRLQNIEYWTRLPLLKKRSVVVVLTLGKDLNLKMSCTILNEKDAVMNEKGNHVLAIREL